MSVVVSPLQNARDSLERMARNLESVEAGEVMALKGALGWGWHAIGLLAYLRLQPQQALFDPWLQDYLHEGEPQLQVERDARWEERERLSFLELLDLLSEESLSILKPEFYQGWQDRTSRCHNLRRQLAAVVGGSIGAEQRQQLLLLLAAYHRLIRLPARVELDTAAIRRAFPALLELAALLLDERNPEAREVRQALTHCQQALEKI